MQYQGGGRFKTAERPMYPVGTINQIVYPVQGGMEDWMYAAGWDGVEAKEIVQPFGGGGLKWKGRGAAKNIRKRALAEKEGFPTYSFGPQSHVQFTNRLTKNCTKHMNTPYIPENRAIVFLVETSDKKQPNNRDGSLGESLGILDQSGQSSTDLPVSSGTDTTTDGDSSTSSNGNGNDNDNSKTNNGHVPRNVRLGLVAVDTAVPYVCIHSAEVSIKEASIKGGKEDKEGGETQSDEDEGQINVVWSVGGGVLVDNTWLQWHPVGVEEYQVISNYNDGGDMRVRSWLQEPLQPPTAQKQRQLYEEKGEEEEEASVSEYRSREQRKLARQPIPHSAGPVQSGPALWAHSFSSSVYGSKLNKDSKDSKLERERERERESVGGKGGNGIDVDRGPPGMLNPFGATFAASTSHLPATPKLTPGGRGRKLEEGADHAELSVLSVERFWLVAWAEVDSSWSGKTEGKPGPKGPPQAHLSNARFNRDWHKDDHGNTLQLPEGSPSFSSSSSSSFSDSPKTIKSRQVNGRRFFPSDPVLVEVTTSEST